jgi:hypothetical protein
MPIRIGVRLGTFISKIRTLSMNPGADRTESDLVSRPGFAGGIVAEITLPIDQNLFVSGTFDFYVGMARFHNVPNPFGIGPALEGDYFYMMPELTARLGLNIQDTGAAPFLGIALSFFQADIDFEDPDATAPGTLDSFEGTVGNWSWIRVVFGVQFEGDPLATRFQIALWNPGRDFGASLSATIAF